MKTRNVQLLLIALMCLIRVPPTRAQERKVAVDWSAELAKAKSGIEKDPRSAFWHNQAGIAHDALGDFESAIRELKIAIDLDPSNPNNYYTLYAIYKRKDMRAAQRQVLLEALEKDPDNPFGHFEFGYVLEEERRWADSLREYQSAKRLAESVEGPKYKDRTGNVYDLRSVRNNVNSAIRRVSRKSKNANWRETRGHV